MSKKKSGKTPEYTLRAIANYDKKVVKKQVVLNPEKEDEALILMALEESGKSFSGEAKKALLLYYGLK